MDVFFDVWDWSKKRYELERTVKIDLEECSIKVYHDNRLVVLAKGETEEIESVYLSAAKRLESWTKLKGDMKNDKHLYSLWENLQCEGLEPNDML